MRVLVTGGAGYIGSHTCLELLKKEHAVAVIDNLSNSREDALKRVERLSGRTLDFHKVDLLDRKGLEEVFLRGPFDAVVHFAGLKAVGESVTIPLNYYHNNVSGTIHLCQLMKKYHVKNIVFSSSATVYGDPDTVPIQEQASVAPTNPYGRTKWMIEEILQDLYTADPEWNIVILRYFNPVGAEKSGLIGEDPNGIPNNLLPFISQVAVGKLQELFVFGNDYPTKDGTGVRDYIHVVDLALGHLRALEKLASNPGAVVYNLGTGRGYSVLEVLSAFERASQKKVPYKIAGRRKGDIATCFADPRKAKSELRWSAKLNLDEMCRDAWRWQSNNPNGYE
ncbi:MAG: UDP-glucose 4-epimerase GalE [Nitrospiria bacterium]